jgi:ssDNA-binding protein
MTATNERNGPMASINTPYATLSFPQLFQPKPRAEGGDAVFSAALIFSPAQQQSPAFKAMQDACIAAAREKWGDRVPLKDVKMPFRDAAEKEGKYAGYTAGDIFINPWTKTKPGIVNAQRQDVLLPEEVWAGQLVRANLSPYAWVNSGKKGVSFGLNHLQIVKVDMPRIDGRASASSAFDDGEVDDSEDSIF